MTQIRLLPGELRRVQIGSFERKIAQAEQIVREHLGGNVTVVATRPASVVVQSDGELQQFSLDTLQVKKLNIEEDYNALRGEVRRAVDSWLKGHRKQALSCWESFPSLIARTDYLSEIRAHILEKCFWRQVVEQKRSQIEEVVQLQEALQSGDCTRYDTSETVLQLRRLRASVRKAYEITSVLSAELAESVPANYCHFVESLLEDTSVLYEKVMLVMETQPEKQESVSSILNAALPEYHIAARLAIRATKALVEARSGRRTT